MNQPESKSLFNNHEYLEKSCKVMKMHWPKSGNPVVTSNEPRNCVILNVKIINIYLNKQPLAMSR